MPLRKYPVLATCLLGIALMLSGVLRADTYVLQIDDSALCETIQHIQIDNKGELTQIVDESFVIKRGHDQLEFVSKTTSFWLDSSLPFKIDAVIENEIRASTPYSRIQYSDGVLMYTQLNPSHLKVIVATCEKLNT